MVEEMASLRAKEHAPNLIWGHANRTKCDLLLYFVRVALCLNQIDKKCMTLQPEQLLYAVFEREVVAVGYSCTAVIYRGRCIFLEQPGTMHVHIASTGARDKRGMTSADGHWSNAIY